MKKILLALAIIFLTLCGFSLLTQGNLWLPLMVILGGTIGIPMGLFYPFSLPMKLTMLLGLLMAIAALLWGFKNRNKVIGQVSFIAGYILWSLIGLMGLGTGT